MDANLTSILRDWAEFALADGIGMGTFIVTTRHHRFRIAALCYAGAILALGIIPILWARTTRDPFWERVLGVFPWGALIGATLCGIYLWIKAESVKPNEAR